MSEVVAVVAGELYCRGFDKITLRRIQQELTLENPAYQQALTFGSPYAAKKIPRELKYYRFADEKTLAIPRGFPIRIDKFKYNLCREPAVFPKPLIEPRPGQRKVIEQWSTKKDKPYFDGTVVMDPGMGKSILGLFIAHLLGLKTLILVHKAAIMDGWLRDIKLIFGDAVDVVVWKGKKSVKLTDAPITIAMVQTLYRVDASFWGDKFGFVICDESHRSGSETIFSLLNICNASFRLGLTATPKRADGLSPLLKWSCGPVRAKVEKTGEETVPLEVVRLLTEVPAVKFKVRGNLPYSETAKQHTLWTRLTESEQRLAQIKALVAFIQNHKKLNAPILVTPSRVDYCEMLAAELNAFHFSADLGKEERETFLAEAREGKHPITVATVNLVGEGVNVPCWTHVIIAHPFSSEVYTRQVIGRVERRTEDKEKGYVWDLVDHDLRFYKQYDNRETTYRNAGCNIRYMRFVKKNDTWTIREKNNA